MKDIFDALCSVKSRKDAEQFLEEMLTGSEYDAVKKRFNILSLLADGEWRQMANVRICGLMMMASFTNDGNQIRQEMLQAAAFFEEVKAEYFADADYFNRRSWGMSEAVIAITIVAVGTSLPELVTAIVAASKHNPQLALGNVIGSNIFNLLMILGVASTVKPLHFVDINIWDYVVMVISSIMLYMVVLTFKKDKMDRIEGVIFFAAYVGYIIYLLLR